jgi:hypothetical protein
MSVVIAVANVLLFIVLFGLLLAVGWVRVHLPAVMEPGDISRYIQGFRVLRVLLRPLWTRGRHALSGPTPSLPVGGRATTGSASWGRGRVPGGPLADPAVPPVAARLAAAVIGVPVPCVPAPVGAHGMGSKPPVNHVDRSTAVPSRHEPTVFVITTAGVWMLPPGGAVEFVQGPDGTAPSGVTARVTAVAGGTRAPGDGPQAADVTGASAAVTPPDDSESDGRGGGPSFLAYLFCLPPRLFSPGGWAGSRSVPVATSADPVEPEPTRAAANSSASAGSRRRGGTQALAEVPLPRQRVDRRESATVPPSRARAGRPEPVPIGE